MSNPNTNLAPHEGDLCTIACDEGHLTTHKLILCDHSKYLQDILSKFPTAEHPIIILTELSIKDIKILVNYMYTGELVITSDTSPTSLLRAAQILKIDSLTADDDQDAQLDEDVDDELADEQQINNNNNSNSRNNNSNNNSSEHQIHSRQNHHTQQQQQQNQSHQNHQNQNNNSNSNNNSSRHRQQQQQQQHTMTSDLMLDDDIDDEDDEDVDDHDDENELMMRDDDDDDIEEDEDDDDLNNIAGNNSINIDSANSRLINSIKNIYSLNQFASSPPPIQLNNNNNNNSHHHHHSKFHQQLAQTLSSGSSMLGGSNTTISSNGGGGSSNNGSNAANLGRVGAAGGLSHHLGGHIANLASQQQQLLASHLDLQDLQDPSKLDKNNKIRCHLCNIGLSDVKCLYRHVLTRHLPEKWGYKCEFCDREFSRDDHLMRHYTTKHKNMEFNREKIRETRRLNREMAKNFHDQISTSI